MQHLPLWVHVPVKLNLERGCLGSSVPRYNLERETLKHPVNLWTMPYSLCRKPTVGTLFHYDSSSVWWAWGLVNTTGAWRKSVRPDISTEPRYCRVLKRRAGNAVLKSQLCGNPVNGQWRDKKTLKLRGRWAPMWRGMAQEFSIHFNKKQCRCSCIYFACLVFIYPSSPLWKSIAEQNSPEGKLAW